jgi:hypothetical protein
LKWPYIAMAYFRRVRCSERKRELTVNPAIPPLFSTIILKNRRNSTLLISMGRGGFRMHSVRPAHRPPPAKQPPCNCDCLDGNCLEPAGIPEDDLSFDAASRAARSQASEVRP